MLQKMVARVVFGLKTPLKPLKMGHKAAAWGISLIRRFMPQKLAQITQNDISSHYRKQIAPFIYKEMRTFVIG